MHIILDIGHAQGTGARGHGHEEHAESVETGKVLRAALQQRGHKVTILDFPEKSNREDLNATIEAANAMKADLGISLHMDASDNGSAHGAHVCYLSRTGSQVATFIAGRLCGMLPGRSNRTVKRPDLAVLKHTRAVWVLVELGFITNAGDLELVQGKRQELAEQIAAGVQDWEESL